MTSCAARALGLALWVASTGAAADETWKNWFDDPFFQVRDAVRDCPLPRGPYGSAADMRKEAHARVERGTSCWLAGRCSRANAYQYDADIADAVRQRFAASHELRKASLWVTVQRRIAWIEGCSAQKDAERRIRRVLHGVPDLEQVIVQIARDAAGPLPYPSRADPGR